MGIVKADMLVDIWASCGVHLLCCCPIWLDMWGGTCTQYASVRGDEGIIWISRVLLSCRGPDHHCGVFSAGKLSVIEGDEVVLNGI